MDSFLLYRGSSAETKKSYLFQRDILKDLNLDVLFKTMARGDDFLYQAAKKVMMIPLQTPEEICYRQEIIRDFWDNSTFLDELYECTVKQQREVRIFKEEMEKNRTRSVKKTSEILEKLSFLTQSQKVLTDLRELLKKYRENLHSEGLCGLLDRLTEEPLEELMEKLEDMDFFVSGGEIGYTLQFGGGLKISEARVNYCMSRQEERPKNKQRTLQKLFLKYVKKNTMIYRNNEELATDIERLKELSILQMLAVLQPYLDNVLHFLEQLALEVAFYKGVLNFKTRMWELSISLCQPEPLPGDSNTISFDKLYELTMAIHVQRMPVGNTLSLPDTMLTLITGANQGGKSTFLRSYGIALLLMQCGMPVPAKSFRAPVYRQIFTHFTRREDEHLNSGRLREELKRMSEMVQVAEPGCIFLLNESFASTTEKEGAKIAEGILQAFYEKRVCVMMVTHLFQLSRKLYQQKLKGVAFLLAERKQDGTRTYRILPGAPEHTSYGTDLFKVLEDL